MYKVCMGVDKSNGVMGKSAKGDPDRAWRLTARGKACDQASIVSPNVVAPK